MYVERCWQHICGTEPSEAVTFYWELFTDLALVVAASTLFNVVRYEPDLQGFLEFSFLYLSITNGWFLYVHHFASRFKEISRIHWILLCIFMGGLLFGVWIANLEHYQQFSLSMVVQRMAVFVMLARVACHVEQAAPLCALLMFFTGDAILCYTLAASDSRATLYLWGSAAIMELHVDILLAIALGDGTLLVPYNLQSTMDRFWAVILAPLAAMIVDTFVRTADDGGLFIFSAITLHSLFAFLYFSLKEAACSHVMEQSTIQQALLLTLLKMLGLAVWSVGACLCALIEDDDDDDSNDTKAVFLSGMLGWTVGGTLILFFGLRLFGGRPHDWFEVAWIVACWTVFLCMGFVPFPGTAAAPSALLSILLVLVSILNILESWASLVRLNVTWAATPEEQRSLLTGMNTADSYTNPEA